MASFGMMNEAYFVGKGILIGWINNFLEIDIAKIEELANGAIYCHLWDAVHPGTIPMSRVDFTVKHEYEYVKNWKLLQNAFQKLQIQKVIPVQRLIKARYQDNLEFCQWFYKYARDTYNGDPDEPTYDAIGRRTKSKGGENYRGGTSKNNRSNNNRRRGKENNRSTNNRPISASSRSTGGSRINHRSGTQSQRSSISNKRGMHNNINNNNNMRELEELRNENKRLSESNNALQTKCSQLTGDHDELSNVAKDIEKERDFYFNKVLAIEQILKQHSDQDLPVIQEVFNLLYQNEEEATDNNQQTEQQNINDNKMNNNNDTNINPMETNDQF